MHWRQGRDMCPRVRIACGYWTGVYIAQNLQQLQSCTKDALRIEILTGPELLNLSRREADLAVRNLLPTQQGLARRRIGRVDFAIYAAPGYIAKTPASLDIQRNIACDWVVPSELTATGANTYRTLDL